MIKILRFFTLIIVISISCGCVSKKKYTQMQAQRDRYVTETKELKREVAQLKKNLSVTRNDFTSMKEALMASNASKNDSINSVLIRLAKLQANYQNAQTNLAKTKDLIKDQKYYNSKASGEITKLNIEIRQLSRDTVSLNYRIKLLQEKAMQSRKKLEERVGQLNQKNLQIAELKEINKAKDQNVAKIEFQLKQVEAKFETINTAFIALRRQLLNAKTAGTPVDPNANAQIDKISKALGHY